MIASRDGITCIQDGLPSARVRSRNILYQEPGATRFICARVNPSKDKFMELFGQQSLMTIQMQTMEEARLQGDNNLQLSVEKLQGFIRLCIIRGVIKGRNVDYGKPVFGETMSRNKFLCILRYIRLDDKKTRPRRRLQDKFAPIREVWESVMGNV